MHLSTSGTAKRDVDDAVAVLAVVIGQLARRVVGTLDDEAGAARPEYEGVVVAVAVLRTRVGDDLHAVRRLEVVGGLHRVADDPDERVPARDGERVARCVVLDEADQLLELGKVELGQALFVVQRLLKAHVGSLSAYSLCARTRHRRDPRLQPAQQVLVRVHTLAKLDGGLLGNAA